MKVCFWKRVSGKLFPVRVGARIAMAYFVVIVISVTFSGLVFHQIHLNSARERVSQVSMQTLSSIQTSVDFTLENANNYSKMIFSDSVLQGLLRRGDIYSNLFGQAQVSRYLYNLIQAVPVIESVCIFDSAGNDFSVSTKLPVTFLLDSVEDAEWYDEVVAQKGAYILRLNADGAFSSGADGRYVSLIRLIRDIDNTSTLGILAINIPEKAFRSAYADMVNHNTLSVAILDEKNRPIVEPEGVMTKTGDLLQQLNNRESGYFTTQVDGKTHLVSHITGAQHGWQYLSVMPFDTVAGEDSSLVLVVLGILAANGLVLFFSSILISRTVTVPIWQLLKTMQRVDSGVLEEAPAKSQSVQEFRQLFLGYNSMIARVRELIDRVVTEQNTLRKAELNTLQAQIKPHFLYNTLDSILSLAMSGEHKSVCILVEALGSYYRSSVSKGREVITVGEEIDMVRNYLIIQKVRYPTIFDVVYNVEESCLASPILKLVLQPLVENALYHGIRAKGEPGTITVGARREGANICLWVADDGVGMSPEKIEEICNARNNASFGFWGTMERVRIFYNQEDIFRLESAPGQGTRITLTIPGGEDFHHE